MARHAAMARHANIWHGFGDVEVVERKSRSWTATGADAGRDPGDIERSVGVGG